MKSSYSYSINFFVSNRQSNKLLFILLGLIPILCVLSCSKDDKTKSCKLVQTTRNDVSYISQSYTYDQEDRLIERESFHFNSTTTDKIEYLDNRISRISTTFQSSPCRFDLYQYNNAGKLDRIIHEIAISPSCQNTDTIAITEYFYNNHEVPDSSVQIEIPGPNSPLAYDKIKYIYDTNENITRIESYNLGELETTSDYDYGDTMNPLCGYFKNGKNNPITQHNTSLVLQSDLIYSYRYESLNELNIPTETFRSSSQDVYTEIKFEHRLDCS